MAELLKRIVVSQTPNVIINDMGNGRNVYLQKVGDSVDLLAPIIIGKSNFKFTLEDVCRSRTLDDLIRKGHIKLYDENGAELSSLSASSKATNLATLKDVEINDKIIGGENIEITESDNQLIVSLNSIEKYLAPPIVDNSSLRTLSNTDSGRFIYIKGNSASVVIPTNLSVGFNCTIIQKGSGNLAFSATGGMSIESPDDLVSLSGLHSSATLHVYETNKCTLDGRLS